MVKKNTINLTYAESFLLSTQSFSAYTLHQQHSALMDQNKTITNLSSDLKKLKDELMEIKLSNTQATLQVSTKIEEAASTLNLPSFATNPKVILGVIGTGVLYYYVMPALVAKLVFPSLNTFLIPMKSAIVGCIPFLKKETLIEFIKDGCTYRLKLEGDQVSSLQARPADSESFKPVSELINQAINLVDSIVLPAAVTAVDSTTTPSVVAAVSAAEQTIANLSALG